MEADRNLIKRRHLLEILPTLVATFALLGWGGAAEAQTFNSGSTGADGALDLTSVPSGTIVNFEPKALKTVLGRDINWDDNRFDFTTITIPAGVTVKLSAGWSNGPVYWVVSGAVIIAGNVDLSGEKGHDRTKTTVDRRVAVPGPGGYPGGLGGNYGSNSSGAAQPGAGPGGGTSAPNTAQYNYLNYGLGGTFSGTKFLVPLVGGSGGGGGSSGTYQTWGAGGGAGGGALLVASSISITIPSTGRILAIGGVGGIGIPNSYEGCNDGAGGSGSGGGIRLVAPLLAGNGVLEVEGSGTYSAWCPSMAAGMGTVRLEAFQHSWTYSINGNYSQGSPLNSFVPAGPAPGVTVFAISSTIGNQTVPVFLPDNPTGSFDLPDATVNSSAPLTVEIRARGVPAGTNVDLYVQSLEGGDQVIHSPTPLQAFDDSTHKFTTSTTVQLTLPPGLSRGYVRAKW